MRNYFHILFCVFLMVFLTQNAYAAYPLGNEAVIYYFEDGAIATSTNSGSTGTTNDGTFFGNASTTATRARFGSRSASFGESGDYMKTYFASSTNPTTQSVAVSFWIYKGSNDCTSDDDHVFGEGVTGVNTRFYIRCASGQNKYGYRVQGNAQVLATNVLSTTTWDHIVLSASSSVSQTTFYVNGVLQGTFGSYTSYNFPGAFYLGNSNDPVTFDVSQGAGANIDEAMFYNAALSSTDVTALYKAGDGVAPVISSIASSTGISTSTITWTTDENASTQVEYGTTSTYTASTTLTDNTTYVTSHTATITGLATSTLYHYRVISVDPSGTIATSSDLTFTTGAPTPPGQPTNLTATGYENKAYLAWTASSGTVTDYFVEYKLSSASSWSTFDDGVSTVATTTVTGLTNGFDYNFRVSGLNATATSTVSSSATGTPAYRVTFISPTPTEGSTISGTSITVYASSSLPSTTASSTSTHIIRLETSGGSLIGQISTTTRYGDYNLTHLTNVLANQDLSLADNSSAVTYVPTTGTLFVVHNRATGADSQIDEISTTTGALIRTVTCTTCGDTESITLISSVASSTAGGFDHTFMIGSENNTSNAEIYRVTLHSTGTTAVNKNDYFNTGISHSSNGGLEGIAYNSSNGKFYVARELSTPTLYEVTLPGSGHTATSNQICGNLSWNAGVSDFSDLAFNNNILYVLSENTNPSKLVAVNITSTSSCSYVDSDGDGDTSSSDTGDWLNSISIGATDQAEGVGWDSTGEYLYIIGEADYFAKYRTNVFTTQYTFSGLSDGNYVLKSSFLDVNGVTSSSTDRTFTINNDATPPVISAVASSTTATTATITWATNELSSSRLLYGLTSSYIGTTTITDTSPRVTSHSVTVSGLQSCSVYHYVVVSDDASSNSASSTDSTFKTTSCSGNSDITSSQTDTIVVASGGTSTLSASGRILDLVVPTGSTGTSSSVTFQINKIVDSDVVSGIGKPDSSYSLVVGQAYSLKAFIDATSTITTFNTPLTISITYNDSDISGIDESTLVIYRYDGSSWTALSSCSVASSINKITCTTDHFSTFGLFGTTLSTQTSSSGSGGGTSFSGYGGRSTLDIPKVVLAQAENNLGATPQLVTIIPPQLITKQLKLGSVDKQVKLLQKILNSDKDTRVMPKGVGSPGKETATFGGATLSAVKRFQIKWKISGPKDPAYGIVGPKTRAKMNQILKNKGIL